MCVCENRVKFFVLIFTLFHFFSFSEEFRTRKTHIVSIYDDADKSEAISVGVNDSIAVFLPTDLTFIEGLELKVQLPTAVAEWQDSVAFCIYDGILPRPSNSQIDYSGKRIFLVPLPYKLNWIMQVALKENNSLKENNYLSKANVIPDFSNGYTFFRFMPVMKGVPEATLNASLNIAVRPIYIDKGRLVLNVKTPQGEAADFVTTVDDKVVELKNNSIILDAGNHNLSLQSENYRNEVFTIYIDKAKTVNRNVVLKSLTPTVLIIAPDNTEIYFDDILKENNQKEFEISEGEHKLRFVMGSYEVIRNITATKGKSYIVNLAVDLQIKEE